MGCVRKLFVDSWCAHGPVPFMGTGIGLCIAFGHGSVHTIKRQPSLVHPCDAGPIVGLDFLPAGSHGRVGIGHDGVVVLVGIDSFFAVAS